MINPIQFVTEYFDNRRNNAQAELLIEAAIDSVLETSTLMAWCGIVDQLYIDLLHIHYDRACTDRLRVVSILVYLGNQVNKSEQQLLAAGEYNAIKHNIVVDLTNILENRYK